MRKMIQSTLLYYVFLFNGRQQFEAGEFKPQNLNVSLLTFVTSRRNRVSSVCVRLFWSVLCCEQGIEQFFGKSSVMNPFLSHK